MKGKQTKGLILLLYGQALYYILTGLWPIFHIESFIAVTGPKYDIWLVQTVGVLIIAIGIPFLVAARTKSIGLPVMTLGLTSAFGLMLVDVVFYLKGDIPAIYLADAVAELILVGAWGNYILKRVER
jgi:hypothetical protein